MHQTTNGSISIAYCSCILIWNTIKTVFIREDFVAQRFENLKFMDRMPHFHVLHNFAIQVFYNMIQTYNPEPDVQ